MNLSPVKRCHAEQYVLISLIAFAVTVIALRTVLWLTGYPQIGADTVHIAHVLWGGLGLFAASLVLLVLSNQWALVLGAVLSGGGVGLFIDEVGKFVTTGNDYFSPAAAPIIYGLFLVTVLVYLRVRRPPEQDPCKEMHRACEQMGYLLDRRMRRHDPQAEALAQRLRAIRASAEDESLRALAASMLDYVETQKAQRLQQPSVWRLRGSRALDWFRRQVAMAGTRRLSLVSVLAICGTYQVFDTFLPLLSSTVPALSPAELVIRMLLQGGVGFAVLAAAVLLALRRSGGGASLAVRALVLGLTVSDLVVFYQDQFSGLLVALLQFVALVTVLSSRRSCACVGSDTSKPDCDGAPDNEADDRQDEYPWRPSVG